MRQTMHILLKDVRHFSKEIGLSLCLLALFTWHSADRQGAIGYGGSIEAASLWRAGSQFIGFVLILSWWTLIIRAVQDESLAGDRQFWVTRPYRWPELLSEKILFVVLFINLPLLVAQLAILRLNGFPALAYLSGLLGVQASFAMVFLLPVALLAAVSATFVQVIVAAFALVLYLSLHSFLINSIANSSMQHATGVLDVLFTIIAVGAVLAVFLLQYAGRRTLISRGIIAATAVLMTVLAAITPYDSLIAREFPRSGSAQQGPLEISLDTRKTEKPAIPPRHPRPHQPEKKISITMPLLASPSGGAEIVAINGTRFSFNLPNGARWQSTWQPQYGIVLQPDSPEYSGFEIRKEVFDAISSTPADIKLELALALYRRTPNQWQVVAEDEDFPALQLGICKGVQYPTRGIECRAPLHRPGLVLATVESSQSTCPASSKAKPQEAMPNTTGYFWSLPYTTGYGAIIDPVVDEPIYFSVLNRTGIEDVSKPVPLICPGTPMHFNSLEFVRHASMVATLNGVRLKDYQPTEVSGHFLLAQLSDHID